jgi:HK97 family phage major capsid protein
MPSAQQLGDTLRKLRVDQESTFAKYRKDDGYDMPAEVVSEVRERNDAITAAAKAYEDALAVEGWATANQGALKGTSKTQTDTVGDARPASSKTIGELFVESPQFKAWRPGMKSSDIFELDLEKTYGKDVAAQGVKALFDTTSWAPETRRLPEVIIPGYEQASVASLMPSGRTSMNAIPYMEETTTTNAAAEVAEGVLKPESALALTEKSSAVRKIATWIPVTDEALEDVPMVESYINSRLRTFLQLRENLQLLVGDGNAPNLRGILNTVGIQTQAKGADAVPDAVYKAMTKVRVGSFFEPTAAVFHPNDWQDVRLLRTTDGIYIWGSPADAGPERIWGLNVLQTTQETENTAIVGAFRTGAMIFRRSDISLQVGYTGTQFTENERTILVEERLALVVFRPSAFCTVTGI